MLSRKKVLGVIPWNCGTTGRYYRGNFRTLLHISIPAYVSEMNSFESVAHETQFFYNCAEMEISETCAEMLKYNSVRKWKKYNSVRKCHATVLPR